MRSILIAVGGRRILYSFLTTTAGIIVAAVIGLLTIGDRIPAAISTWVLAASLFAALEASILVVAMATFAEFSERVSRSSYLEAVPTSLICKRRRDMLTINANGDGELEWYFDMVLSQSPRPREFHLPIYSELPDVQSASASVRLLSVLVEGRDRLAQSRYEALERRSRLDGPGKALEFGVLRIPLDEGKTQQTVRVRLHLGQIFWQLEDREGETFWVDVAYVTEELEVRIDLPDKGTGLLVIPDPVEQGIEAGAGVWAGELDFEETRTQSRDYRVGEEGSRAHLSWVTRFPKLGYRYKLKFRLVASGSTGSVTTPGQLQAAQSPPST